MPLRRKGKAMHGTGSSLLRHCSLVNIAIPTCVGLAISQELANRDGPGHSLGTVCNEVMWSMKGMNMHTDHNIV